MPGISYWRNPFHREGRAGLLFNKTLPGFVPSAEPGYEQNMKLILPQLLTISNNSFLPFRKSGGSTGELYCDYYTAAALLARRS